MDFIIKNGNYNNKEILTIKYGLENILLFLEKFIVIFAICIIFKITKTSLIFMIFYLGIRTFSGGLHMNSSLSCLILSIIVFVIIPYYSRYIGFSKIIGSIIFLIILIIFNKYSPADTHKKPIKRNRNKLKFYSLIVIGLYFILFLYLNSYLCNLIILSLIIQSILILPITYRIFKLPYNNGKEI